MPLPANSSVHVDTLLTDFAIGYGQEMSGFVGDEAATMKRVQKQSDKYQIWDKADFFRDDMAVTAANAPSPVGEVRMSTASYFSDAYRLKSFLPDEKISTADDPAGLERGMVRYLMHKVKIKRENVYGAEIFQTGKWTENAEQTGVSGSPGANQFKQWNDAASDPLADHAAAKLAVRDGCGVSANTVVYNEDTYLTLLRHADIVGRYQYTTGGRVTHQELEQLLDMRIIVGRAVHNTATEGQAAAMATIFEKAALFLYLDDSGVAAGELPTAVTGFSWNDYDKVDATGAAIDRWREDDPKGEWYRAMMAIDYKITANDAGVFYASAIA